MLSDLEIDKKRDVRVRKCAEKVTVNVWNCHGLCYACVITNTSSGKMANIAAQRIKREFKEVIKSEEVRSEEPRI